MKINKIMLDNIGSYEGRHTYNYNTKKNLNVIIGENGAGKTTLLNALIFCFFGTQMYGSTQVTNEYRDYIVNLLNCNTKKNKMSVEIEFYHLNNTYIFLRQIEFSKDLKNFKENLNIKINGIINNNFNIEEFFSKDLIEAFFFNGETILNLIDNNKINQYVTKLIDITFDFKTFNLLEKDINKAINGDYNKDASLKYKQLKKEYDSLIRTEKNIKQSEEKLEKEINLNLSNITLIEDKMKQLELLNNTELNEYLIKEKNLKNKNIKYMEELNKFCTTELFLFLQQDVLKRKKDRLVFSIENRKKKINKFYKDLDNNLYMDLDDMISIVLEQKILQKNKEKDELEIQKINELIEKIKINKNQLNKIRSKLSKNKKGFEHINYNDNLEYFKKLKIENEMKLKNFQNEKTKNKENQLKCVNEIQEEEQKILENTLIKNSILEKKKLLNIIKQYNSKQKEVVYKKLSIEVLDILNNHLLRKANLLERVIIKENEIKLEFEKNEVNYNSFSSGEKQLLIFSFILGVIKISKLEVPLVLDTFIGRLDKTHTRNIFDYFRNELKNQVIILTTNQEFSYEEYDYIKNDLASIYTLENDGYTTKIKEGYYED